jgi:hypothetical protein
MTQQMTLYTLLHMSCPTSRNCSKSVNFVWCLVRWKIALLQAFLHADDYTLWNLAPEAVNFAAVQGGIWEAKCYCKDLFVEC